MEVDGDGVSGSGIEFDGKRSLEMAVEDVALLRNRSLQEYLGSREPMKLQASTDDIEDESYKKCMYDLATMELEERDFDGYMIPEPYDAPGFVDQAKRFAAVNKRAESEYDLVFDDQTEGESSSSGIRNSSWKKLQEDRRSLPVYKYKESLLKAIEDHQVIVIVGETDSGKTTQIPQYLHEAGYTKKGVIGCTQPRRVAAINAAARVANETGVKLGHEVGYSIRFEDCTSDKTVLKYMTDGKLLREILSEPYLFSYSVVMIDEAHERTVSTDFLFGLVKDIARYRPELKLLILSDTLNALKFSDFFDAAPVFKVPDQSFPVEIHYTAAPVTDYVDTAVATALQIHVTQPPGDVLVFLTGQEEIEQAEEAIKNRIRGFGYKLPELMVCVMYANLQTELQMNVFEPTPEGTRKVILATNIAETSLTIDNIKYVIDSGLCKKTTFDPTTGMESLLVTHISKASAIQRSRWSGRTGPGKCYRLYTKAHFETQLEENRVPELQQSDLTAALLILKSLGIHDIVHFDFMNAPPVESVMKSLKLLFALGALNNKGEVTKVGRSMSEFPLAPMLSKMIIASINYQCSVEIISIAAMLSVSDAIFHHAGDDVGDHIGMLNIYNKWKESNYSTKWCNENFINIQTMKRAKDIYNQLEGLLKRTIVETELKSNPNDHKAILKSIIAGYFPHCARLCNDGVYRLIKKPNECVWIHPSSSFAGQPPRKLVVYHELVFAGKEYMRLVSEIKPEWIMEIAPHYYPIQDIEDIVAFSSPFYF